jgi:PPM family protein phosphatase
MRRPLAAYHTEVELAGLAAVTDRGHRHQYNEDAVALARVAATTVAVVCDGVSSSTRPDAASHAAVDAAAPALLAALGRGTDVVSAMGEATQAAQAAATLAAGEQPGSNPPCTTFVCAMVTPGEVVVGWVGDSRAYWVPDPRPHPPTSSAGHSAGVPLCLTVDDSFGSVLVRWLGADAGDTVPHVRRFVPSTAGRVVVCSDGLFRYRPDAAELAAATECLPPLATAQALVRLALDAGGSDNVTAAIVPYPPENADPPGDADPPEEPAGMDSPEELV